MITYLLSICIPTYNRSSLLKELIEDLVSEIDASGYLNTVQIVIVDGHSNDNTAEIMKEWASHSGIKYYRREKKEGIDKDILKCVELADGKYCWLFSDDDRLMKGAISHLIGILKADNELTGCFCNRISYDFQMERIVAEVNRWPGKLLKDDNLFVDKSLCFKKIGMDLGFISSQVVRRDAWQKVVEGVDFGGLYRSYYLMVHIIGKMMDEKFKWLYISKPLVKQRTGNDSLLQYSGIIQRHTIEHNSFEKIVLLHFSHDSAEYNQFFKKMVCRLPRVVANLKSQNVDYKVQMQLFTLLFSKYNRYWTFWIKVVPMFVFPNRIFAIVKKIYFNYWMPIRDYKVKAVQ